MDQRQVGEGRRGPAEGVIHQGLARGVGQVLLAPGHVGDAHVVVVHRHGEIVDRRPVRPKQYEVLEILVREPHRAPHQVLDHRLPVAGRAEPDHVRLADLVVTGGLVAPGRTQGVALGARRFLGRIGFLGRHVTGEGVAGGDHAVHRRPMQVGPGMLEHRLAVPVEAEPLQAVEDHLDAVGRGAFPIGVLDAQEELSSLMPGIEPVEQRRPGVANMHGAGGRGGDPCDDGGGGHCSSGNRSCAAGSGARGAASYHAVPEAS